MVPVLLPLLLIIIVLLFIVAMIIVVVVAAVAVSTSDMRIGILLSLIAARAALY
ncbi:MAG TPA: hypothetical protein VE398_10475 [Acidobacteriota bacterium]|nr:hypothetical protein [Acidobacteriota bacterium]